MRLLKNQRGSTLISSLIAVSILFILFLSVFSYGLARYSVHVKSQYKMKSRYLAESGINYVLHSLNKEKTEYPDILNEPIERTIDGIGTISVACRPFGAYLLLSSKGESGNQITIARALIGKNPGSLIKNAITLTDDTYPLTVTGRTIIKGDVCAGRQPIAIGQIDGQGAYHEPFHLGKQVINDSALAISGSATIIDDYMEYITREIAPLAEQIPSSLVLNGGDGDYFDNRSAVIVEGNLEINGLNYDAKNSLITVIVGGSILIKGNSRLDGLIEIISEREIVIEDSAVVLRGIYCAGDSLVMKDDCYFRAQGIAKNKLVIKGKARIENPSLLLAMADDMNPEEQNAIELKSKRKISTVCMLVSNDTLNTPISNKVYIDSASIVEGIVFSSGYTDLRGSLYGSVITKYFYYYHMPTTYVNWLRHAFIDRNKLNYHQAMPLTFVTDTQYEIFSLEYH